MGVAHILIWGGIIALLLLVIGLWLLFRPQKSEDKNEIIERISPAESIKLSTIVSKFESGESQEVNSGPGCYDRLSDSLNSIWFIFLIIGFAIWLLISLINQSLLPSAEQETAYKICLQQVAYRLSVSPMKVTNTLAKETVKELGNGTFSTVISIDADASIYLKKMQCQVSKHADSWNVDFIQEVN